MVIDGQNYALLTSYRGKDTATIQGNKFDYSDNTYARYIKVVGTYNSANTQFHLSEVRAYGEEVDYDLIQLKMEADEKLSIYENVDLTKYTETTVKVFNESLESLKAVLKDETSTKEAIQTALDQMQTAYDGLIKKENGSQGTGGTTDKDNDSQATSGTTNKDNESQSTNGTTNKESSSQENQSDVKSGHGAETGDNSNIYLYVIILFVSVFSLGVLAKKKTSKR